MGKTKIEWADSSWSPVTGCTKISDGCRNCYAERMARRLAGRYGYPEAPHHFDVTLRPDRLDQPLRWKKPRTIFVCSMGDLFHEDVPDGFILRVFDTIAMTPRHTYQILTKRPISMVDWYQDMTRRGCLAVEEPDGRICDNAWLGVSVENQETADERREDFEAVPAARKFVSYEPALGPVDWTGWEFIDLLIFGGESGHGARPAHPDWFRNARDWAGDHGVARFFKQWGAWFPRAQWANNPDLVLPDDCDCTIGDTRLLVLDDNEIMHRVGKKRAGRLLDGREWNEMPRRQW